MVDIVLDNLICDITAGTARKSKEENTNDYQKFFFMVFPKSTSLMVIYMFLSL